MSKTCFRGGQRGRSEDEGTYLVPQLAPFLAGVRADDRSGGAKFVARVEELAVESVALWKFCDRLVSAGQGGEGRRTVGEPLGSVELIP